IRESPLRYLYRQHGLINDTGVLAELSQLSRFVAVSIKPIPKDWRRWGDRRESPGRSTISEHKDQVGIGPRRQSLFITRIASKGDSCRSTRRRRSYYCFRHEPSL